MGGVGECRYGELDRRAIAGRGAVGGRIGLKVDHNFSRDNLFCIIYLRIAYFMLSITMTNRVVRVQLQ